MFIADAGHASLAGAALNDKEDYYA